MCNQTRNPNLARFKMTSNAHFRGRPQEKMAAFPAAGACAELLLADRKDAVYEGELKNLLREVLERSLGAHALSQLLPELSAASSLLYLALALGRRQPQQTLGEEFCDVIRVTSDAAGHTQHVRVGRRLAWLALAVLPPYIAARSAGGWHNLSQLTWSPRERMEQQMRLRRAAAANGADGNDSEAAVSRLAPRRALKAVDAIVTKLNAWATAIETEVFPASYEFTLQCVRAWCRQLHLAAFYVFAKYFDVSKRLARIHYTFVRKDLAPGINLSLLVRVQAFRPWRWW